MSEVPRGKVRLTSRDRGEITLECTELHRKADPDKGIKAGDPVILDDGKPSVLRIILGSDDDRGNDNPGVRPPVVDVDAEKWWHFEQDLRVQGLVNDLNVITVQRG